MRINHLIWDRIFHDPTSEIKSTHDMSKGYISTYRARPIPTCKNDDDAVRRLYSYMKNGRPCDYYTNRINDNCIEMRGICVHVPNAQPSQPQCHIPSLKILSLLAIHKIYAHEYRDASLEYTRAFRKFGITKRHIKKKE